MKAIFAPEPNLAWRRCAVTSLFLAMTLHAGVSGAQSAFQITSPPAGSVLTAGQPVTIAWTGGDPAWSVDVYLIDITPGFPFAAVAVAAAGVPKPATSAGRFRRAFLTTKGPAGTTISSI
jgi:hypothetical protein